MNAMKTGPGLSVAMVGAALAMACGSSAEIAGDRDPIIAKDEGSGGASAASGGASSDNPDDPVSSDGSGGSTATPEPPPPNTPACKQGFEPPGAAGQKCDFVARGLCFGSSDVACACAGCATDKCMILESYPAQIRCQR